MIHYINKRKDKNHKILSIKFNIHSSKKKKKPHQNEYRGDIFQHIKGCLMCVHLLTHQSKAPKLQLADEQPLSGRYWNPP